MTEAEAWKALAEGTECDRRRAVRAHGALLREFASLRRFAVELEAIVERQRIEASKQAEALTDLARERDALVADLAALTDRLEGTRG